MADPPLADLNRSTMAPLAATASQDPFGVPLPVPLTSFVGREREVAAIAALIRRDDVRLVTLTGPGGVGKTRLALRVVEELQGDWTHGIAFVDLAPIAVPDLVAPTIAAALGLRETGAREVAERLLDALRDRPLLLVLDNFEQVVEAAPLVMRLLLGCRRVKIIVTSRIALRLSGERVFIVEPLALPDHDERQGLPELLTSEAVALLVGRAQDVRPDFLVSESNAHVAVEICRRVDGLPLAIELAAARIAHLPLPAVLARLEKRLPFLTSGPRDVPERQRTLRETIAWSHDLLPTEERVLFRRLAVFQGGARPDAVEAVATERGDLSIDVFEGVTSLVASSLLRQVEDADGEPRYVMLETIREYGLERLAESGEEENVRRSHAAHFLVFAESDCSGPGWPGTPARVAALEREQTNFRAALAWSIQREETETALRLVAALGGFWRVRARLHEGRAWSERALALTEDIESPSRVRVYGMLGWLAFSQGDELVASESAERALAIAQRRGDIGETARALGLLGCLAAERGETARAEALLVKAEALSRQADDRFATASILYLQGLTNDSRRGSPARATACYEESLVLWREVGDMWGQAVVLANLAWLVRLQGNARRAAQLEREALTIQWALGAEIEVSYGLLGAAQLALAAGQVVQAARLGGAAARLRERTGAELDPLTQAEYGTYVATTRATLGETAFTEAWSAGARLPLAEAVAEADALLAAVPAADTAADGQVAAFGLSPREREVLRLVAAGRSNREIAEALSISIPTAKVHVRAILTKLGLDSRTAAAAFAIRHGMA